MLVTKVGSFVKITDIAYQAISGIGFMPRALILWADGISKSSDGWQSSYRFSVGLSARNASNVITQGSISGSSQDAQADSNASRSASAKALIISEWGENRVADCDLYSFDADGFTLYWTSNNEDELLIHYMALGGVDIENACVLNWLTGTSTGDVNVSGAGFEPDFILNVFNNANGVLPVDLAGAEVGIGFATRTQQYVVNTMAADGAGTTASYRRSISTCCVHSFTDAGAEDSYAAFRTMDADGFTVNVGNAPASSFNVFSLCLKGGRYYIGSKSYTSFAGGDSVIQNIGFRPSGVLFTHVNSASGIIAADGGMHIGAADGVDNVVAGLFDDSGQATSDCNGFMDTGHCIASGASLSPDATLTSLNDDGFTLNWEAGSLTNLFRFVAFGSDAIGVSITTPTNKAEGVDTYVRSNMADTNYGTAVTIELCASGSFIRNALMKPDLSAIPSGAVITDVKLHLFGITTYYDYLVNIYRVLLADADWNVATATWNYMDGEQRWAGDTDEDGGSDAGCSVVGADFSSSLMGTAHVFDVSVNAELIIQLGLTEFNLLMENNCGMVLFTDSFNFMSFHSANAVTDAYRPYLEITYQCNVNLIRSPMWGRF